jgi:hypothetical protein
MGFLRNTFIKNFVAKSKKQDPPQNEFFQYSRKGIPCQLREGIGQRPYSVPIGLLGRSQIPRHQTRASLKTGDNASQG